MSDKMNFIMILSTTIPQSVLSLIVGFFIVGEKQYVITKNYKNYIKLFMVLMVMVVTTYFGRMYFLGIISMLINVIGAIIAIKYICSFKLSKSAAIVTSFTILIATSEILYIPHFLVFVQKNMSYVYSNDLLRFVFTLPTLLLQLFAVLSLWDWNVILIDMKKYKNVARLTTFMIIMLVSVDLIYFFTFARELDKMDTISIALRLIGFFALSITNIVIFKFITLLTMTIGVEADKKLEQEKEFQGDIIKSIKGYLERGRADKAYKICQTVENKNDEVE